LLWWRKRIIAAIPPLRSSVGKPRVDRFYFTLKVFALTLLTAAGLPLLMLVTGWQLEVSSEGTSFSVAVGKALASEDPQDLAPGDYTVVLEPSAVASLLLFAAYKGFGAQQVEEGSSFLAGRLGESVAAADITIRDDGNGGAHMSPGSGLEGLNDRIAATGGTLDISSGPDGTTLKATIPCG